MLCRVSSVTVRSRCPTFSLDTSSLSRCALVAASSALAKRLFSLSSASRVVMDRGTGDTDGRDGAAQWHCGTVAVFNSVRFERSNTRRHCVRVPRISRDVEQRTKHQSLQKSKGGSMADAAPPASRTPAEFLKSIKGRQVIVKLNSGVDYHGTRTDAPTQRLC